MLDPPAFPGPPALARLSGRIGLVAFAALVAVGVAIRAGSSPTLGALGGVVALAGAIPLFLTRTRWAAGCAVVAGAGAVVYASGNTGNVGWFALLIVAAWCVLDLGVALGIGYWVASLVLFGAEWLWVAPNPGWAPWMAGMSVTVLASLLIRHQFVLVERLKAAQADLAERSRAEERARIARELHDVIAHSLTVSLLHLSSARLAVEHDPAGAARALAEAERVSRQSLAEVRATMGMLRRAPGEGGSPASGIAPPAPELAQLPALVESFRGTGAVIDCRIEGELGPVPTTVGSTAYRIVQEGLTNAGKHAPGAAVRVDVTAGVAAVEIVVDSAGRSRRRDARSDGMGIGSMQARAEAVGGTCTAGPGGSGWLVKATLPLDGRLGEP
ncbi:MAG: sensor histidine kinase [Actinomycetota bacterium]